MAVSGVANCRTIGMRQQGTQFFQCPNNAINANLLLLVERVPPLFELVRELGPPFHSRNIICKEFHVNNEKTF